VNASSPQRALTEVVSQTVRGLYGEGWPVMQLLKVEITGLRRFATRQSMVVEERLVAVVGRNEVGKSSLLDAIHFGDTTYRDCRVIR
jgi:AAA15 family ATPase/GTPase